MIEQDQEKLYRQKYNEGYLLAQEAPEIAEQLSKATGDSIGLNAFKDGRQQFLSEKIKAKIPSWLKDNASSRQHHDLSKTTDKDIEPEK